MSRFSTAIAAIVAANTISHAMASASLRTGYPSLEALIIKIQALEDEIIPLRERVEYLENEVSELSHQRQLGDSPCSFTVADGVCQFAAPLATNDLLVRTNIEVFGDSKFGTNVAAAQIAKSDPNVVMTGKASFSSLVVDESLDIHGRAVFDGVLNVVEEMNIEGSTHLGDTYVDGELFIAAETIHGNLLVEGEILVEDDATFLKDVDVKKGTLDVKDLKAKKCDGCV